jgi:hypothetical protein
LSNAKSKHLAAENLLEKMADLLTRMWRGLDNSEKANHAPAQVAFAREARQCLESYSTIFSSARAIHVGAGGGDLGERIRQARLRRAEEREHRAEEESQAQENALAILPPASPKPI